MRSEPRVLPQASIVVFDFIFGHHTIKSGQDNASLSVYFRADRQDLSRLALNDGGRWTIRGKRPASCNNRSGMPHAATPLMAPNVSSPRSVDFFAHESKPRSFTTRPDHLQPVIGSFSSPEPHFANLVCGGWNTSSTACRCTHPRPIRRRRGSVEPLERRSRLSPPPRRMNIGLRADPPSLLHHSRRRPVFLRAR